MLGAGDAVSAITYRQPFDEFAAWFAEAQAREPRDADAMTVATATADGVPAARMILLKGVDEQGFVFYTLDVQKTDQPRLVRRDTCLQCHQGPATLGVPGIMIGSVYPDATGMPASRSMKFTSTYPTQRPNQRIRTVTVSAARSHWLLSRSASGRFTAGFARAKEGRVEADFDYRAERPRLGSRPDAGL